MPMGEPGTYTLPIPITRYLGLSMFLLWPGEFSQAVKTVDATS